jgi:hypothetical protein
MGGIVAENTQIEPTVLAYLAGMIDGDGYITITRSTRKGKDYFGAQVGIAGTRREPHDLAASLFGGKVSCYQPANPNHRPQFQWQRMGKAAVPVLGAILPYLLIKSQHAVLALELQEHAEQITYEDPFPWFGPDYDPLPAMRRMREEMIEMNQSRNRLRKKAAGRLLDGVEHNGFPEVR